MDLDYRKKSSELVYDLINRDNPNLPVPVSPDNCKLGTPIAATDGFRNTRIPVMALDGGFYMGSTSVTYRRLSQADLFKQGWPIIEDYLVPADYGPSGSAYVHIDAALRWVNNRYGTVLGREDTDRIQVPNAVQKAAVWLFPGNNPAWVGVFYWDRRATKKPVSEQIPELATNVIVPVSGVASGVKHRNLADFMSYGADFSRFKDLLQTFTTTTTLAASAASRELINYLGIVVGRPLNLDVAGSVENGMSGCRIIRYALPNANYPEANSADYNYAAVILPPSGGGWFAGRFLLHYKV